MRRLTLTLFLAVVYFVVVSPLALAIRWAGRNPFARGARNEQGTYWRRADADSADARGYERGY